MKKILVVDDELDLAESIASILESEGYLVRVVAGGTAALEIMQKEHIDLLILDVMMPIVKGSDVIEKMKSDMKLAAIPILLMSASKEPTPTGIMSWDHFLRKPFDINELVTSVQKLV